MRTDEDLRQAFLLLQRGTAMAVDKQLHHTDKRGALRMWLIGTSALMDVFLDAVLEAEGIDPANVVAGDSGVVH